ncbi:MAG: hypothetical protein AAF449_20400 [Myxococcota bacterium]
MNDTIENEINQTAEPTPLINLYHPKYGLWFWWLGGGLLFCGTGISLIFVDLVVRLKLTTRNQFFIDFGLPFVIGVCLSWIVFVCGVAVGVEGIRAKRGPRKRGRPSSKYGQKVQLAVLGLSVIIAGVRVAKTMEAQEAARRASLSSVKKAHEQRLDRWRASEDGQEYAKAKAQIRRLRTVGAQLLEDGRRLSHPKKRRDGAALLKAADAIDITKLEKTMPSPPNVEAVAAPMPWWKFANVVVWPALLEFVCIELFVLAVAFWSRHAFSSSQRLEDTEDLEDPEEDGEDDEGRRPGLRIVPQPNHPVFEPFDFDALDRAIEAEPDCAEVKAWVEAKDGLDLVTATWRGLRITASPRWTKRVGSRRRRFVWPVIVESSGRAVFIGTQAALRLVPYTDNTDR